MDLKRIKELIAATNALEADKYFGVIVNPALVNELIELAERQEVALALAGRPTNMSNAERIMRHLATTTVIDQIVAARVAVEILKIIDTADAPPIHQTVDMDEASLRATNDVIQSMACGLSHGEFKARIQGLISGELRAAWNAGLNSGLSHITTGDGSGEALPPVSGELRVTEAVAGAGERGVQSATITLSANQLRDALEFINPDGPADELQCEDELTFGIRQHSDDDGAVKTGMCCWNDDTDGVYPLDGDYSAPAAPAVDVAVASPAQGDTGQWMAPEALSPSERAVAKIRLLVCENAWPASLNENTLSLVIRFAAALAIKLAEAEQKYGYSDRWMEDDWMDGCRASLLEHLGKGDPRDVAAYCAFLWHHGESTAPPAPAMAPMEVTPEMIEAASCAGVPGPGGETFYPFNADEIKFAIEAALLAAPPEKNAQQQKYKAELYDEVWAKATGMGYVNVTTALAALADFLTPRTVTLGFDSTMSSLTTRAKVLIADAESAGMVVRIETEPLLPPAMGNYKMVASVQERRDPGVPYDQLRGPRASPECADKARMDWIEAAASNGCVTMCFELAGGVHVTLEGLGEKPEAYRNKDTIRAAIDCARAAAAGSAS